ncbi:universal stress protein [Lewinella sp. JB7]|uniref:universal stress protein n=1 Tax=Lewinella sp. JB7 TaxID=2962887 RepID=UPI0020C9D88F|nr:universal stress protein [Lewinella sp. JB7]MCP9234581.1 universal stress protein [Lewinella sp. JB7]
MKNIIVPVDFSDTSAAAVRFGTYLAEVMDLNLRIVHVFDTMISTSQTISSRARAQEQTRLANRLEEFARHHVEPVLATFQGRLNTLPAIRTAAVEGTAAQTILWQSTDDDTALIVMGGVGAGAGLHPPGIFGEVARHVAQRGGCPVLLIPKDYGYPTVAKLAIAFDDADDIRQMGSFARRMIQALHPEVHFVHVRKPDAREESRNRAAFRELAHGPDFPTYVYHFDALPDGKVEESLLTYVVEKDIDLLVLGGERRGFFDRLFEASHLKPLLRRCAVPLLVIPFPD